MSKNFDYKEDEDSEYYKKYYGPSISRGKVIKFLVEESDEIAK